MMTALVAPFVLGLIVRIRSQAADRRKAKVNQSLDKGTPTPPSSSSDGEDKPEDSYWTRFKKWCSEHSVAIGLGITLVAAALIYIYREDISDLVYGSQPQEGSKSSATSQEGEEVELTPERARQKSARAGAERLCNYVFFGNNEQVNAHTFQQKSQDFSDLLDMMQQHYAAKENTTDKEEQIKKNIRFFKTKFQNLLSFADASEEKLEQDARFLNEQFGKSVEDQDPTFRSNIKFLLRAEEFPASYKLAGHWFQLTYAYLLDLLEERNRQTS